MKRWLNVVLLALLFALPMSVDEAEMSCQPPEECEEWLHFSDGDVAVCVSEASALTVEFPGADSHAQ